jgi:hypothetical protein
MYSIPSARRVRLCLYIVLADSLALPGYIVNSLEAVCSFSFTYNLRGELLPLIYPWLRNRCLAIKNSPLLVSADMSHVPVARQGPGRNIHFVFSKSPRPALRSTQPPIQWVPGALSPGIKQPGHKDLQLLPRSRKYGSIHPLPIRLHGKYLIS